MSPEGRARRGGQARATGEPFWDYSLALYARDGVAEACLGLQERRDLDVNLLLFCCWAGSRGRGLAAEELARLVALVGPWREGAIRPLRRLRRWLKEQDVAPAAATKRLRERVKADELEAEAIEQALLTRALAVPAGRGAPAIQARNLVSYFAALDPAPDAADAAELAVILCAACPGLLPLDAMELLA